MTIKKKEAIEHLQPWFEERYAPRILLNHQPKKAL
jgi:hypothetical protein